MPSFGRVRDILSSYSKSYSKQVIYSMREKINLKSPFGSFVKITVKGVNDLFFGVHKRKVSWIVYHSSVYPGWKKRGPLEWSDLRKFGIWMETFGNWREVMLLFFEFFFLVHENKIRYLGSSLSGKLVFGGRF